MVKMVEITQEKLYGTNKNTLLCQQILLEDDIKNIALVRKK